MPSNQIRNDNRIRGETLKPASIQASTTMGRLFLIRREVAWPDCLLPIPFTSILGVHPFDSLLNSRPISPSSFVVHPCQSEKCTRSRKKRGTYMKSPQVSRAHSYELWSQRTTSCCPRLWLHIAQLPKPVHGLFLVLTPLGPFFRVFQVLLPGRDAFFIDQAGGLGPQRTVASVHRGRSKEY